MLITTDPQQFNAYAYAGNSPITWSDPLGLCKSGSLECNMVWANGELTKDEIIAQTGQVGYATDDGTEDGSIEYLYPEQLVPGEGCHTECNDAAFFSALITAAVSPITETAACLSDPSLGGCFNAATNVGPGTLIKMAGKAIKAIDEASDLKKAGNAAGGVLRTVDDPSVAAWGVQD